MVNGSSAGSSWEAVVAGVRWDAEFVGALAGFLRGYLAENPPPSGARLGGEAVVWARNLEGVVRDLAGAGRV